MTQPVAIWQLRWEQATNPFLFDANGKPQIPIEDIPEQYWEKHTDEGSSDDMKTKFGLLDGANAAGEGYVRNLTIFQSDKTEPVWTDKTDEVKPPK